MKLYETRTFWAHGSAFKVRRVNGVYKGEGRTEYVYDYKKGVQVYQGYRYVSGPVYARMPSYVIFCPRGKFLARVHKRELKRYLRYFGLTALKEQRTTALSKPE